MGMIEIDIWDATGNKRQPAEVPDDAETGRLVYALVEKLNLPTTGPDGMPLVYKLHHKRSGRQLLDTETLAVAGVAMGDVLRLQPEITAGALASSQ